MKAAWRTASLLGATMVVAAAVGLAAKPTGRQRGAAPPFQLETLMPRQFGTWSELPDQTVQLVNPQTQQLLDRLYSQLLTRTYVNASGYRIMLSLAYSDDQRGELQLHQPEVCYPAQGFTLHSNVPLSLPTPFGSIDARRLDTSRGARRELVTYWFTVGDTVVRSPLDRRIAEVRTALAGMAPDGLLFRVSSIDGDRERAFQHQAEFVAALLAAVPSASRFRLTGLAAAPHGGGTAWVRHALGGRDGG